MVTAVNVPVNNVRNGNNRNTLQSVWSDVNERSFLVLRSEVSREGHVLGCCYIDHNGNGRVGNALHGAEHVRLVTSRYI